jgi:menaquinone-dependent protoporphyrinogen oxidase
MIKLIMVMTKGPTNSKTEIEYTNWKDVVLFTKKLIEI